MKPTEPPSDLKRRSRGWSDDMSSEAIDCRLAKVSQLYAAWKTLNRPQVALADLAAGASQDTEHKTTERKASE